MLWDTLPSPFSSMGLSKVGIRKLTLPGGCIPIPSFWGVKFESQKLFRRLDCHAVGKAWGFSSNTIS